VVVVDARGILAQRISAWRALGPLVLVSLGRFFHRRRLSRAELDVRLECRFHVGDASTTVTLREGGNGNASRSVQPRQLWPRLVGPKALLGFVRQRSTFRPLILRHLRSNQNETLAELRQESSVALVSRLGSTRRRELWSRKSILLSMKI
jgi:hypothetical protein